MAVTVLNVTLPSAPSSRIPASNAPAGLQVVPVRPAAVTRNPDTSSSVVPFRTTAPTKCPPGGSTAVIVNPRPSSLETGTTIVASVVQLAPSVHVWCLAKKVQSSVAAASSSTKTIELTASTA